MGHGYFMKITMNINKSTKFYYQSENYIARKKMLAIGTIYDFFDHIEFDDQLLNTHKKILCDICNCIKYDSDEFDNLNNFNLKEILTSLFNECAEKIQIYHDYGNTITIENLLENINNGDDIITRRIGNSLYNVQGYLLVYELGL